MARNVFISFRYSDGKEYKNYLSSLFDDRNDTVDYSEDINRSQMSESTIQKYLYGKLRRSSVTIVLITPLAVNHKKDLFGLYYDDWMYDEIRYSLENREGNRSNGLIAVYTPEAEKLLMHKENDSSTLIIHDVDNLFRKNMMNVKSIYKKNPKPDYYDSDYDSYCSLIPIKRFSNNVGSYINMAVEKRNAIYKYDITKRL